MSTAPHKTHFCAAMLSLLSIAAVPAQPGGDSVKKPDELVLFSLQRSAPLLDGELNDDCWKGAQVATGFLDNGKIEKSEVDTEVFSSYDETNLYFGIRVHEPKMSELKADARSVWAGDCVELFLNTGSNWQFIVDSESNIYTIRDGAHVTTPLRAVAKRHANRWVVEAAVPFAALGTGKPADNQRWAFNVGRERYAGGSHQLSSWAALGVFTQKEKWGKLAFYSKAEVIADMAYWKKDDADPFLRRPIVSGFDIAAAAGPGVPTLWNYDPFSVPREKNAKWYVHGLEGGGDTGYHSLREKYPEFYNAAMGLNRALVAKAFCDERLRQFRQAKYYKANLPAAATKGRPARAKAVASRPGAAPTGAEFDKASENIDNTLNAIYQSYGVAFNDDYNTAKLAGIDKRLQAVSESIRSLQQRIDSGINAMAADARKTVSWLVPSLRVSARDKWTGLRGAGDRISYSGMRFKSDEFAWMLTEFDSINIDWPFTVPDSPSDGRYSYPVIDKSIQNLAAGGRTRRINFQTVFGSQYWGPSAEWLEKKIEADPDMLMRSEDGLTSKPMKVLGGKIVQTGLNPNNAAVQAYMADYLKKLAAHTAANTQFVVTGWEDQPILQPENEKGESLIRSPGYNQSSRAAFRNYLKTRYASIEELNRRWGSSYGSFDTIEPPADKYIKPPTRVSGLTYEFERWVRVNHVQLNVRQRNAIKAGNPNVPVMIDDSKFFLEMNGYLLYKNNAADIYSFHSSPSNEDALWAYFGSMNRRFKKSSGYFENYWEMYRSAHLADERLARNDVRQFFFQLFSRDIRYSTWWLTYANSSTQYTVAYGGGFFGLDYDQTVFRWSSAELAPMFSRGRSIEKALLSTQPETPKIALVQPCSSIFNLASMGRIYSGSPTIRTMLSAHYQLLDGANYTYDYLPEEMVLDGRAALSEYKVLVLPYAPWMTAKFSKQLKDWVAQGGVLLAIGPFGLMNEYGAELPAADSLSRTRFPGIRRHGDGDWDYSLNEEDPSKPMFREVAHGRGRLLYYNQPIETLTPNPQLKADVSRALAKALQPGAFSPDSRLRALVREGMGQKYVMLSNRDVEKSLQTTLTVQGRYKTAVDVVIPGGFPVPCKTGAVTTDLKISLEPGEWTLVRLQS